MVDHDTFVTLFVDCSQRQRSTWNAMLECLLVVVDGKSRIRDHPLAVVSLLSQVEERFAAPLDSS